MVFVQFASVMNPSVRSTEKSRVSSCPLADIVAEAVIAKYRSLRPENEGQSVLAGIVAVQDEHVHVISIGMGNKFNPTNQRRSNAVNDCHAEVLARRSFKLWLIRQWEDVCGSNCESPFFKPNHANQLTLLPNVKFVLYVSSAPCGNACIRKWGKAEKEKYSETQILHHLPDDPHEPFHPHAHSEGQTAISFKGTSPFVLSCSDKILKWNVLGLEGVRLSPIVSVPIRISAIVVGRKFVKKHAMRAFCCRLSSGKIDPEIRAQLHHPSLLCTATKFDDGTFEDGKGATFSDSAIWYADGVGMEELNGLTGLVRNCQKDSALSSTEFSKLIDTMWIPAPTKQRIDLGRSLARQIHQI